MARERILYIDDERINLTNFTATFADDFAIATATNGEEALGIMANYDAFNLVIADQRMPGISGIDVLYRIRELYPDTVRMVITAYTETTDLIDAINRGHVFRYIVKPWNEAELRQAIIHALDHQRLSLRNKELLAELQEKNSSLIDKNIDLEERTAQRTRELLESNQTLSKTNDELHRKIRQLRLAREETESIQHLVPICSYCKKIRDGRDCWHDQQAIVPGLSQPKFTQGVCPSCYEKEIKPQIPPSSVKA